MPLPALDSVIGKVPDRFEVKKVLMRSTEDDLVAVMTNMSNYRIILCRPRKSGAWLLERRVLPYACISDIAFLGDGLYGVTKNADLIALELGEKKDGRPTVKSAKYVITRFKSDDEGDGTEDEVEVSSSEGEEEVEPSEASSLEDEEALEYNETSGAEDEDGELEDRDLESNEMSSSEDENKQLASNETSSAEESDNNEEVGDNL